MRSRLANSPLARLFLSLCDTLTLKCHRRNNAVARRDKTVWPVFWYATVDCRWWLSCMMRAYYICIWPVHAGLPKSQVSSLKSQVSTRSGLPKSQVSSLKYLSVFFIFFSFHDKSNCVYSIHIQSYSIMIQSCMHADHGCKNLPVAIQRSPLFPCCPQ